MVTSTNAIYAEKGCRLFYVQTVSVPRTNAICTGHECRLIIRNFTNLRNYNPELSTSKNRETITKTV
ncbi:hypothetical protein HMPREF0658_1088 [Hoylesella marshii DSM 16973 = JCM 13450]|uniref:Uncharacterized protein n=1 Tax=Hoylesella marshii DSM 16973 = JCM 13450 TaxID=862515 RepID=E0NSD7_9BACT|nr:hypothetical protein HMPREF0658_1088 [Hoylesella marshii DSM 16973 = JCM 13450]